MSEFENLGQVTPSNAEPVAPAQPAAPSVPSGPPEQSYDVKVNGQTYKVPLNELINGYQRQADYTRKTQEFAERERRYQAAFGQLRTFLEDRNQVEAYIKQKWAEAHQQAPQNAQADDLITREDLEAKLRAIQEDRIREQRALQEYVQLQNMQTRFEDEIEKHIQGLLVKHKEIATIPRIQKILRDSVLERGANTLEEAKAYFDQAAGAYAEAVRGLGANNGQHAAVLQNGIEPPGGQGVAPPRQPDFKSVTDPRLRGLVMQDLMKTMSNK